MDILFGIIILLMAVLASNIINKFIPQIAAPITQIILGVLLICLTPSFRVAINSEILFALFVAPLVYYSGRTINRKVMWKIRGSIANMAVLLVVVSCGIAGLFLHTLIPAISIASGVVLIAALGPTDDVAVDTLERNYHIPGNLLELLKGESVFNDVSSIIIFQIGLEMIESGKFSIGNSLFMFLKMSLGGVLVGLLCSLLKMFFAWWLCSQGIVNQTTHVLLGVITPILFYCIAEHLDVSGILAIFVSGLVSSSDYPDDNPDVAQITFAINNFWEMGAFTLEGLVFVILGMEIPDIAKNLWQNQFSIQTETLFLVVLFCFIVLLAIRFFWYELTMPQKDFQSGLIFALSGARGAVTMASVSSIPLVLANGSVFPQRELLITIAMGVVLISILVAHFVLPIFVEKKDLHGNQSVSDEIYLKILKSVEAQIRELDDGKSSNELGLVLQSYRERIQHLERENSLEKSEHDRMAALDKEILLWKKECIEQLYQSGKISENTYGTFAEYFLRMEQPSNRKMLKQLQHKVTRAFRNKELDRKEFSAALNQCDEVVYQKLLVHQKDAAGGELERLQEYERIRAQHEHYTPTINKEQYNRYRKIGLEMERDLLQSEYEQGNLTKDGLNSMKNNIALLEMQIG